MALKEHAVTVTTDGSGDGTGYTPHVTGKVIQIRYVNTDLSTPDITVTREDTGQALWTEAGVASNKLVLPRQGVHDLAGASATYDGTRLIREPGYIYRDRVKIVVAGAGDTKSGTFHVMID